MNRILSYRPAIIGLWLLGSLPLAVGGGGGSTPNIARFAYVANTNDDTVSIYRVDPATGQLHHRDVAAGNGPLSMTVDPLGRFAYVANQVSRYVVRVYSREAGQIS